MVTTDKRNKRHFGEPKKVHTKIKHLLLSSTLEKSLSIANWLCPSFSTDKKYTYVDLFAGSGAFDDGSKGSPLIALDTLTNHINSGKDNFSELRLIATEKNQTNYTGLCSLVEEIMKDDPSANQVETIVVEGDWETYDDGIKNKLKQSSWGFIFADPYSTELKLAEFKNLLKSNNRLKDILVFFNYRTLRRQDGRGHINDIERVCQNMGVAPDDLMDETKDFSDLFQKAIVSSFSDIKEFVIGVSLPIEIKGKFITSDYFYLIFATSSIALVDYFLQSYEEALKTYGNYNPQKGLFENYNLLEVIKSNESWSLFDLFVVMTKEFLSWRKITTSNLYVPTLQYLVERINELHGTKEIIISAPTNFFYSNNDKGIKYTAVKKSKATLEQVKIKCSD